jgi:hypothetical protein
MKTQILNSKGEPVVLNQREAARAGALQLQYDSQIKNSLGYDINITTLTTISKSIVEQKFFTIRPSLYMPIRVGDGAWSSEILTYRDFQVAADFETGNINTGSSNSRLAEADGGVDSVTNPIINWAKQVSWTFFDLQQAAKSGNWDLVTSKERSRKKNWDLGIQKIAFLGSASNAAVMGLLTQSSVNSNTSIITQYINQTDPTEFAALVQTLLEAYRVNAQRTAWPTHFTIPESDYNGLATPVSADFPNVSMLEYLLRAFRQITMNPNFEILPCAYGDQAQNADVINKNRYALYNFDEDTMRMDIPVDYTNTLQNTINGFQFQNVGYGQYTGVLAYRPLEVLYFDWNT